MSPFEPDDWRRVRGIFDRAAGLPEEERVSLLAAACSGDASLQARVRALLEAHDKASGFLEDPCVTTFDGWTGPDLLDAQFGPYRLESCIGRGGMGEVYRARDTRLGRSVAIKVLRPQVALDEPARERFEREARVVAALSHSHICTLHDVGTYQSPAGGEPLPYLVMELLHGETLGDRLSRGALPIPQAVRHGLEIASALDAAHRAGVVHRDLKPRNVMLTPAGAKLLDFGLARSAAAPAPDVTALAATDVTTPGTVVGTLHYMSPEQLEGRPTDARSDIFAFGCVLYEMLCGRKAFDAGSGPGVMSAILSQAPTPLRRIVPSLPAGLDALVSRCLEKERDRRWQSIAELAGELQRIDSEVRQRSLGPMPRLVTARGVVASAVLMVLVLAGGSALVRYARAARTAAPSTIAERAIQLAVLPLRPIGEVTDEDQHLGVGIADAIITRLATVPPIGLRPTAAVLAYANQNVDTADVGRALSVGHVLFGTIQRERDAYRVSVQLVQTDNGSVTWAHSYDIERRNLMALQDTIAGEVVDSLRLALTRSERERVNRRYTANAEAFDLYLRGRAAFVNYTDEASMRAAMDDFLRALAIDPGYALARAGLSITYAWFSIRYAYEAEAFDWGARAEHEARAALSADPSLAEATLAMAGAAGTVYGGFNWPAVLDDARQALAIDPTLELAHVVRMRAFFHLGLFDRMAEEAREAYRLNPGGNIEIARLEVAGNLFNGFPQEARSQAHALLRRSRTPAVANYLGLAQFYAGDVAAARATLAGVTRAGGRPDVRSRAALASVEAAAGDHQTARARVLEIERGYMDHHVAYSLGAAWAQLGDARASVRWLQTAAETGFPCYPWLMKDRLLDPIRQAPEFTAFLDVWRQRYEQAAARYAPSR